MYRIWRELLGPLLGDCVYKRALEEKGMGIRDWGARFVLWDCRTLGYFICIYLCG